MPPLYHPRANGASTLTSSSPHAHREPAPCSAAQYRTVPSCWVAVMTVGGVPTHTVLPPRHDTTRYDDRMMIRVPGMTDKGIVTTHYSEHVDLFPTLTEAAALITLPLCPYGGACAIGAAATHASHTHTTTRTLATRSLLQRGIYRQLCSVAVWQCGSVAVWQCGSVVYSRAGDLFHLSDSAL
jgi:hypothetical protein